MTRRMIRSLRKNDFALTVDEELAEGLFREFLRKECAIERVRAAEPVGHDAELWQHVQRIGGLEMACDDEQSISLVGLVVVAEQFGRHLAPVPWIEGVVAARLAQRIGGTAAARVIGAMSDGEIATIALRPVFAGEPQLIPAGAIADVVLAVIDGDLVAASALPDRPHALNQGSAPLAWIDVAAADTVVLASGADAAALLDSARREWMLLVAGALAGVGGRAVELAVEFASERHAFGVPIGTFQAISHSLVDARIGVDGSRNLTRKAAWYEQNEREAQPSLVPMSLLHAQRAAAAATQIGVHVQGGFGLTFESDMQLYFRRSKTWPLMLGDPHDLLMSIGDALDFESSGAYA